MAGNKPLKKAQALSSAATITCLHCNQKLKLDNYYTSNSIFYKTYARIPYCKDCLNEIYEYYLDKYTKAGNAEPERKAIERVCMAIDLYYSNRIFDTAMRMLNTGQYTAGLMALYVGQSKKYQHRKDNYDTTMIEKYEAAKEANAAVSVYTEHDIENDERIEYAESIFGSGFEKEDYVFLYNQYTDWVARHECETKVQEEIFKRLSLNQLAQWKTAKAGGDTKDLDATFLKQLDSAKLQPKQNSGDTISERQTLGTLIDKWENTRPIPEPSDDLKDVDGIAKYLNVFFKGHLARCLGLKNGYSQSYWDYMKKYTIEKPEYKGEDDDEALFDAVFGGQSIHGGDES